MRFDSSGALLVVEAGAGIVALNVTNPNSTCPGLSTARQVLNDTTLTHGIEISPGTSNGSETLYASSADAVYRWTYSPQSQTNTSAPTVIVNNMNGEDHVTRTLRLSKFAPGLMIVTRGSSSNLDYAALDITSGHSEVKAFNISASTSSPYDFDTSGVLLGWGLRNDVGVDEDPITGAIYTVENGADQITRYGIDIHALNPAEELNFLGFLNGTSSPNHGANFGYPLCFTAWSPSSIPNFTQPVGTQFAIDRPNTTVVNDTACSPAAGVAAARLAFHAHMAPISILFNPSGTAAWVTFHGSWDSSPPVGYKLSVLSFADGAPTEPSDSSVAALDVVSNANVSACPGGCFRPAGLAWDGMGRLWMSSDATGEIYVVTREDGMSVSSAGSNVAGSLPPAVGSGNGTSTSTATGTATTSTAPIEPPQGSGTGVVSPTGSAATTSATPTSGARRITGVMSELWGFTVMVGLVVMLVL